MRILRVLLILAFLIYPLSGVALAATPPGFGQATSFAVLGGQSVSNTGASTVNGDLGVNPGTSAVGFPPGIVNGTIHTGDALSLQAQNDAGTTYDNLAGQACDADLSGTDLGGLTLVSGTYCFTSNAQLTGKLTLDAQSNSAATFIFKTVSGLNTGSASSVVLINGGNLCNVFWKVGSSATLGTGTDFLGNIVALTSASLATGANILGRVIARNGSVTLDNNQVNACPAPTKTPTKTITPTHTKKPTKTKTPTVTVPPTQTTTPTQTDTPMVTATPTQTDTPTNTSTVTQTATQPEITSTPTLVVPSETPTPTLGEFSPTPTGTFLPTAMKTPTQMACSDKWPLIGEGKLNGFLTDNMLIRFHLSGWDYQYWDSRTNEGGEHGFTRSYAFADSVHILSAEWIPNDTFPASLYKLDSVRIDGGQWDVSGGHCADIVVHVNIVGLNTTVTPQPFLPVTGSDDVPVYLLVLGSVLGVLGLALVFKRRV